MENLRIITVEDTESRDAICALYNVGIKTEEPEERAYHCFASIKHSAITSAYVLLVLLNNDVPVCFAYHTRPILEGNEVPIRIVQLYTFKDKRKKGYAKFLITKIVGKYIDVSLAIEKKSLKAFYMKLGFHFWKSPKNSAVFYVPKGSRKKDCQSGATTKKAITDSYAGVHLSVEMENHFLKSVASIMRAFR